MAIERLSSASVELEANDASQAGLSAWRLAVTTTVRG